jgi:hypothetical protein
VHLLIHATDLNVKHKLGGKNKHASAAYTEDWDDGGEWWEGEQEAEDDVAEVGRRRVGEGGGSAGSRSDAVGVVDGGGGGGGGGGGEESVTASIKTVYEEVALAKMSAAMEWLTHLMCSIDSREKVVVFAHHRRVMNLLQKWAVATHIRHVRVDGHTCSRDRYERIRSLGEDAGLRMALVSVTAGGQGVDLSAASTAVFVELPPDVSWCKQVLSLLAFLALYFAGTKVRILMCGGASRLRTGYTAAASAAKQYPATTSWHARWNTRLPKSRSRSMIRIGGRRSI